MKTKVIGDYKDSIVNNLDVFYMEINCDQLSLHWSQCHQLADFLSSYFACFFPDRETENDMTQSISYVMNELTENAVKFRSQGDVFISSGIVDEEISIIICNQISTDTANGFQTLLNEITSEDPGELLIKRIEQNAMDSSRKASGLGLLTIMNDYKGKLGWTFESGDDKEHITVRTMVRLASRKED